MRFPASSGPPPFVLRISVKLVFFFIIVFALTDAFRAETPLFQAKLGAESAGFWTRTSEAAIVYDSGGWGRRGVRFLWSLWSSCCGFSTFGSQTSVLCTSPLWCGGAMMSKHTYDGVGTCVVSRALPDTWPWGNWEAGFVREFGIYITQRFTGQTFPPV